ncbi:hypothetical protein ACHAQJ_007219 [Trichoderma viride]
MPAIDVAMARSLRGGLWETVKDSIARSLATEVVRRDIVSDADTKISDVKQAFSSWSSCMAHVYCNCCYCLKCCGNCCGCCDAPGGARRKHLDEPYNPQQSGGYRQEAPMAANMPAPAAVPAFTTPASHGPPQYAEFDVSKHDADALPAMPSWETANSKQIVLEEEVEMDNLPPPKKEPVPPQNMNSPRYRGQQPLQQQQQQRPMGRNDPYNQNQNNSSGYMNSYNQQATSPYGAHDQGYAAHDQGFVGHDQGFVGHDQAYGSHQQNFGGHDQAYGAHEQGFNGHEQAYGAHEQAYGVHEQGYNGHAQEFNGHDQAYGVHDQHYNGHDQPYDNHGSDGYGTNQPYDHAAPVAGMRSPGHQSPTEYGIMPRQMTPGPAHMPTAPHELDGHTSPDSYGRDPYMRKSPGPGLDQRRSPGPLNDFAITPQNKPVPFRTYTPAPQTALQDAHDAHVAQPPPIITNSAGFDFSSGYSRPQTREGPNYDRRPSESHEREDHEGYPGYKPYSPTPQNWTGI